VVCFREAEPLAKDCTLVLVWHTQSRLFTPSPPPRLRQDKNLNFGGFLHFGELRIFNSFPAPQAQAGQKFEFWRISSLWRIADFSTHFQSLVYWAVPKDLLGMVNLWHSKSMFFRDTRLQFSSHRSHNNFFYTFSFLTSLLESTSYELSDVLLAEVFLPSIHCKKKIPNQNSL
jgi:hypothetical protein